MNNITAQDVADTIYLSDPQQITRLFLFNCEAAANELNTTTLNLNNDEDQAEVWAIISKHELEGEAAHCTAKIEDGAKGAASILQVLAPNGDETEEVIDIFIDSCEWDESTSHIDNELRDYGWERVNDWDTSDTFPIRRIA